ncbi:MAG: response regulator [Desulfobacteraceae bacterium]|nr:MAG: response regulator [Desulfobacteraceae bacterium]
MSGSRRGAVLFVDDEPRVLQGLQRMLRRWREEWTLGFVESGREAIARLAEEPFDVLVTDLRMPGMGGEELLRAVKEHHPRLVRIIFSGEMDPAGSFTAVHLAHRYLAKPCEPEALVAALTQAFALRRWVEASPLQGLLGRIDTLPSLPALYARLLSEIQAPHSSPRRVGELIERDVGMTAKILQVVNSAFFGLPRQVVNAQDAVVLLGYDTLKALVLSSRIFGQFDTRRLHGLNVEALWEHSARAGLFARTIAAAEALPRKVQDEAFTAGMLHDIGKLVLAQNFPEEYAAALDDARQRQRPPAEVEQVRFGASHAELGAYLLGLWGIEEGVVQAIADHHQPLAPAAGLPETVGAANRLAHVLLEEDGRSHAAGPEPEAGDGARGHTSFGHWQEACRALLMQEVNHV